MTDEASGGDLESLKKIAQVFGDGKYEDRQWICLGCTQKDPGFPADYCATCEVRTCAMEQLVRIMNLLREGLPARRGRASR